ncbi:MAG: CapA family protein [Kofleriaceae bacterium]
MAACGVPTAQPPASAPVVAHSQAQVASSVEVAPPPVAPTCATDIPKAACAKWHGHGELSLCAPSNATAGKWRYALVAPLYSPFQNIAAEKLSSLWTGGTMSAASETATVLATQLGSGKTVESIDVRAGHWALVPVDELDPRWSVITIANKHPLREDTALTVGLCGDGPAVTNLDPDEVTTLAMTGVTAMARFTAKLMDKKGVTYPARDVASWFEKTDYVHISNEVSFVPDCKIPEDRDDVQPFCSRESYIGLMEAMHANLVELDGSHLTDWGYSQFRHTIEMYEQRGWHFFGGGRDQIEATKPLLLDDKAGTKLALIGCNMPHSTGHWVHATPDVGYCDLARIEWQIADLKQRGYTPIVSIQHEEVYSHRPPDSLVVDFRRMAAAGAAVVFGSQAHWAHPFEMRDGTYIHYGAGNFFFDQAWAEAQDATNDRFYFAHGKLLTVEHLFTRLEETGRPRPMHDGERAEFLKKLDDEREKLPTFKTKKKAPTTREATIPDSFIIGREPILISIALGDTTKVTLRHATPLKWKRVKPAIVDYVATKYGIARDTIKL